MLPKSFVHRVILACHDDNGHLGMEIYPKFVTREVLLAQNGRQCVHIHIHTCNRCLRFKQPQERSEMQPILVLYPMELVQLDFLTLGGKADDNRSVNILIVTVHFTKYAQAYVISKQTAVVVAQTLWENFLVHYRWPEKILTDQGKSFENNLIRELCGLAHSKETPY